MLCIFADPVYSEEHYRIPVDVQHIDLLSLGGYKYTIPANVKSIGTLFLNGYDLPIPDTLESCDDIFLGDYSRALPTKLTGEIPIVENIDGKMLRMVGGKGEYLQAGNLRLRECGIQSRVGWAIILAGVAGRELARRVGDYAAGHLIYRASRPDRSEPDFLLDHGETLRNIREDALAALPSHEIRMFLQDDNEYS